MQIVFVCLYLFHRVSVDLLFVNFYKCTHKRCLFVSLQLWLNTADGIYNWGSGIIIFENTFFFVNLFHEGKQMYLLNG